MAQTDERLTEVETGRQNELTESKDTFQDMADASDKAFDEQISGIDSWQKKQEKAQQAQTDLAIQKLGQEQKWAEQDYKKEQSAAYTDWQKQSNQYGAKAEQMAAQGMANTGYSESSQVAMYNQYQNRVAIARQAFERSNTEFAIAMEQARAQNSAVLAEIAFNAWKEKSTLAIQKVVSNQAIWKDWLTQQNAINTRYDAKYATVLDQINTEAALAETKRHNQASEAATNRSISLQERQFEWQKSQAASKSSGGSSGGGGGAMITKNSKKTSGKRTAGSKSINNTNKNEGFAVDSSINTYDKAVDVMKIYGVPNSYASNVKTREEWTHRKEGYSSYQAYLKDYVSYACTELAE